MGDSLCSRVRYIVEYRYVACFYVEMLVMSCSLTIPDDFPGSWALQSCQNAGGFLGNDVYRDVLPRLILNKKDTCSPTVTSLIGTFISCMLNGLSLFFVLVFLLPQTMLPGSTSRWVWYYIIMGLNVFIPVGYGLTYYIASTATAFDNKEDTPVWSVIAFSGSMLMYVVLIVTGLIGLIRTIGWSDSELLIMTFMVVLLMPIAKSLFPVLILLLGPGSIPMLSGKSFLEFCTT